MLWCSLEVGLVLHTERYTPVLPSGKTGRGETGVDQVTASENLGNAQRLDAFGLYGDLRPEDYAYTTWGLVEMALKWRGSNRGTRTPSGAWTTATTSDPNQCVIIDYRNFNGLVLYSDGRIIWS